ncbi:MAG: hypothetical protein RLY16_2403 [Bacteroidota bacterium]|jgi:peroxiredoxin
MKRILLVCLLIPGMLMAQKKAKTPVKSKSKNTKVTKVEVAKPAGFAIEAAVTGYPDGTGVTLLNGQTGQPEAETTLKDGKFSFSGRVETPDFRVILFNKKPPYITLFLDNSSVKITGDKDAIERAAVVGSPSHVQFEQFNQSLLPYRQLFGENAAVTEPEAQKAREVITDFVTKNPTSYVSPLAVIRFSQITSDILATEKLYNLLGVNVKESPMAGYVLQQITDGKRNAIGTIMPDFTQADTSGNAFTLSSLRGKYVLVDFWASWCRPCRQENPNVVASYEKYKNKNFTVLGVSLDKAKNAWLEAIKMDGLNWPQVSDLQGWANAVAQQFQIQSIPQNFLLDPEGRIIGKNLRGEALERKLSEVIK